MLGFAAARPFLPSFLNRSETARAGTADDRWCQLARSAIFVLGSPRSGTTWLAKIFDSHPEILYRHEPDELTPANPNLEPVYQIAEWLHQRSPRAAAKRPHFRKAWRPAPLAATRQAMGAAVAVIGRLNLSSGIALPDMVVFGRWPMVRAAIKLVNWDASRVARALPGTRCLLILRHPCGQVASTMAGVTARRFGKPGQATRAPIDLTAAEAFAARQGIDAAAFAGLPYAAQLAWNWLAFNEPAVAGLADLPNARIVIYEDLCRGPEAVSRDLFAFTGLDWHASTAAFLGTSTHDNRPPDYFDVFRETGTVADHWRQSMSKADQEAVRSVVSTSTLSGFWSDLAEPLA
jgi:hypothetical protein